MKEVIKASSGPNLREIELLQINKILSKESVRVKEMLSDGNCLYRCARPYVLNYAQYLIRLTDFCCILLHVQSDCRPAQPCGVRVA